MKTYALPFFVLTMPGLFFGGCNKIDEVLNGKDEGGPSLRVFETSPGDKETDIPIDSVIYLRFGMPLRPSTVNNKTFIISGPDGDVSGKIEYNSQEYSITFRPESHLSPGTTYSARLTKKLRDIGGNYLQQEYRWEFTTSETTLVWSEPERISSEDQGENPVIRIDGAGNAICLWTAGSSIWTNRFAVGSGWGEPEKIGEGSWPSIAMNAPGKAIVAWSADGGSGATVIRASLYDPGSGWGAPEDVGDQASTNALAGIGMDAGGNAMVVWTKTDGAIHSRRYASGQGWGDVLEVESAQDGSIYDLEIAMDPAGNSMVLWSRCGFELNCQLRSSVFSPETGWFASVMVGGPNGSIYYPEIEFAMNPSGQAIATWITNMEGSTTVLANRYAPGTGWRGEEQVLSLGTDDSKGAVALDREGNALVIVSSFKDPIDGSAELGLWAFHSSWTSGWTSEKISKFDHHPQYASPQMAMDADGNAIALWTGYGIGDSYEPTSDHAGIWANRYIPGSGWLGAKMIEHPGFHGRNPAVAMGPEGDVIFVWQGKDRDSPEGIWASRFLPD